MCSGAALRRSYLAGRPHRSLYKTRHRLESLPCILYMWSSSASFSLWFQSSGGAQGSRWIVLPNLSDRNLCYYDNVPVSIPQSILEIGQSFIGKSA